MCCSMSTFFAYQAGCEPGSCRRLVSGRAFYRFDHRAAHHGPVGKLRDLGDVLGLRYAEAHQDGQVGVTAYPIDQPANAAVNVGTRSRYTGNANALYESACLFAS